MRLMRLLPFLDSSSELARLPECRVLLITRLGPTGQDREDLGKYLYLLFKKKLIKCPSSALEHKGREHSR